MWMLQPRWINMMQKKTSNCIVQVKYIYEPNTWNPKRSATVLPTYTHPREGIREAGIFIVLVNVSTSKPVRPTQDETNIHCPHWYESGWNNGHCTRPFNEWMNLFSSFRCGMRRYLQDWWQSSRVQRRQEKLRQGWSQPREYKVWMYRKERRDQKWVLVKRLSTRDCSPSEAELNWIITVWRKRLKVKDEWITHEHWATWICEGW